MKKNRLSAVLLAAVLFLSACKGEEPGAETVPGEVIETPEILTHVYEGEALMLPEGLRIHASAGIRLHEDRMKLLGQKSTEKEEKPVTAYYICEMGQDGSEPVLTEITLPDDVVISMGALTENGLVFASRESRTVYHLYLYDLTEGIVQKLEDLKANLFPDNGDPDWFRLSGVETDADGYIYLTTDTDLCVLNPDGTRLFDYSAPLVSGLTRDREGNVYLLGALGPGHEIRKIIRETESFGEVPALPKEARADSYAFGEGYEVFYSNSEGLYGADAGMTDGELLISWSNSNLSQDDIYSIYPLGTEAVLAVYQDSDTAERIPGILKKAPDVDLSARTVLEVAYVSENYNLSEAVIRFNRKSREARVVTRDYSVYNTKENNYTGGADRLMNDILNGLYKPDIVCGGTGDDRDDGLIPAMIEKGLYTDLYTLMEDSMAADLLGCVKNYYDADGKLAAVCDHFMLSTLLADADTVDGRTSWTLGEMMDFAGELDGAQLLAYTYRGNAAEMLMGQDTLAAFVDMESRTCTFDSPVFSAYLEFIAGLPEDHQSAADLLKHETGTTYEIYQTGQSALYRIEYRDSMTSHREVVPFRTEDVVRIGYPSEDGNSGVVFVPTASYLVLPDSGHPEAAWDFIEEILTGKEISLWELFGMSSLRSRMLRQGEQYRNMQMFYSYRANSQQTWDGSGENRRELDEFGTLDGEPGILVDFSMERFMEFLDWLDTVGVSVAHAVPGDIEDIVNEEISAYLAGSRSAEKTADIIQSRVSIWLAEHS